MKKQLYLILLFLVPLCSKSQILYQELNDTIKTSDLMRSSWWLTNPKPLPINAMVDVDLDGIIDFRFYFGGDVSEQNLSLTSIVDANWETNNRISQQGRRPYKYLEIVGIYSVWWYGVLYSRHYSFQEMFSESLISESQPYYGLKIEKEDGTHYGWIEIQLVNDSIAEGSYTIIKNIAYNEIANRELIIAEVITSIDSEKKNHQMQYINNTLLVKFLNQNSRRLKVLDVNGKIYFDEQVSGFHAQMQLTKHQMYIISIEENGSIQHQKILIR